MYKKGGPEACGAGASGYPGAAEAPSLYTLNLTLVKQDVQMGIFPSLSVGHAPKLRKYLPRTFLQNLQGGEKKLFFQREPITCLLTL